MINTIGCNPDHPFEFVECKGGESYWKCKKCGEELIQYEDACTD